MLDTTIPHEVREANILVGVRALLIEVGEDPDREGLKGTPERVLKAYREMTSGYKDSPTEILSTAFVEDADSLVILREIPFVSVCEHHLLPFMGSADVAYLPAPVMQAPTEEEKADAKRRSIGFTGDRWYPEPEPKRLGYRLVGLSKLARLVDCFARRFQMQERLTKQVAEALVAPPLGALGAAVILRARHSCLGCRGVKKQNATMITSAMLGEFRDDAPLRAEFLRLCRQ